MWAALYLKGLRELDKVPLDRLAGVHLGAEADHLAAQLQTLLLQRRLVEKGGRCVLNAGTLSFFSTGQHVKFSHWPHSTSTFSMPRALLVLCTCASATRRPSTSVRQASSSACSWSLFAWILSVSVFKLDSCTGRQGEITFDCGWFLYTVYVLHAKHTWLDGFCLTF